jgi:HupE/UreJ protein
VLRRSLFLALALVAAAGSAYAHLASDSYLRIEIDAAGTIGGQWDIALRDLDVAVGLDADQDGAITWGELRAKQREVEAYAFGRLALAGEGFLCRLIPAPLMVDHHAGSAYAVLPFSAECPSGGRLSLRYRLLFDLDPSHRGLLTIAAGRQVSSDVLTPEHAEVAIDAGPASLADQIGQFLRFGFDHILLGYDHLLFIAVLLVTAALRRPAGNGWVAIDGLGRVLLETIKTLTAFTLAHAIVLTAALITQVSVTARLVEPAVAVTIMLAALDNIRPILPRLRWQVAFLFGLIHGLSFASALGPMRLPPLGMALALGSFNLGIEAGQIALALLLVPIAFALRHEAAYRRLVAPAASLAILLLAGAWFLDRVFAFDLLSLQAALVADVRVIAQTP